MNENLAVISRDEILIRIRGEYLEMPGLCLTHAQAQRLWGLDAQTCASLLASLTESKFLYLRNDGTYCRLSEGATAPGVPPLSCRLMSVRLGKCSPPYEKISRLDPVGAS